MKKLFFFIFLSGLISTEKDLDQLLPHNKTLEIQDINVFAKAMEYKQKSSSVINTSYCLLGYSSCLLVLKLFNNIHFIKKFLDFSRVINKSTNTFNTGFIILTIIASSLSYFYFFVHKNNYQWEYLVALGIFIFLPMINLWFINKIANAPTTTGSDQTKDKDYINYMNMYNIGIWIGSLITLLLNF
jgi:hypothetical protein